MSADMLNRQLGLTHKPHLLRRHRVWFCLSHGYSVPGASARDAWMQWAYIVGAKIQR